MWHIRPRFFVKVRTDLSEIRKQQSGSSDYLLCRLMNIALTKLRVTLASVLREEDGQELIEYALVCALIAFAAVAGMHRLANGINTAFTNVSTTLSTNA